jgi:hypothetical protein
VLCSSPAPRKKFNEKDTLLTRAFQAISSYGRLISQYLVLALYDVPKDPTTTTEDDVFPTYSMIVWEFSFFMFEKSKKSLGSFDAKFSSFY